MKFFTAFLLTIFISISCFADNHGFLTSVTTLAVADVRQTLTPTQISAYDFIIQNPAANVVSVFIGGLDVTTSGVTKGIELVPGSTISLASTGAFTSNRYLTSTKIFIISTGTSIPVVIGRIIE